MKAVILAAGEGRRLRPLTETRPKPMLPAANRPLLEHVVEAVATAGIREIVLVVGYRKERIQSYFGDGDDWDVELDYVEQSPQLGTGHALLQAESLVGDDFVALNGDRIVDPDIVQRVRELREETGDIVMAVTEVDHPEEYGVVYVDDDRVQTVQERPPAELARSNRVNAGVYGFGPDIFAALRDTDTHGELGITTTLADRLSDRPVRPVNYQGRWLDVSTPWDLVDVNGSLLDDQGGVADSAVVHDTAYVADGTAIGENATVGPNATVLRGTAVGEHASVGPNAVLNDTILLPDATVRAGTVLKRCTVGANAEVGAGTIAGSGTTDVVLEEDLYPGVQFGGLVGDNGHIGGHVTIEPGTIIGNDVTVASGATVGGRVDSGAEVVRG